MDRAQKLLAAGKGILAADESTDTMGKRFKRVGVTNSLANRAAWRQALLTAPDLPRHISGVILSEETLHQPLADITGNTTDTSTSTTSSSSSSSSSSMPPATLTGLLASRGILVGVKVDQGLAPLNPGSTDVPAEPQTKGLEDLTARCAAAAAAGAVFTKWRAVFLVDPIKNYPSTHALASNAAQLAAFAAASQAAGLVPLVEPEVLVGEGPPHSLQESEAASAAVLGAVVAALQAQRGVLLEGLLLKPAMVLPGPAAGGSSGGGSSSSSGSDGGSSTAEPAVAREVASEEQEQEQEQQLQVAAATLRVLRRTVPPAVPGIAFLSGGQGEAAAVARLAAMTSLAQRQQQHAAPWVLTFSFGRALQASALEAWAADPGDVGRVHEVLSGVAARAAAAGTTPTPAAAAAAA